MLEKLKRLRWKFLGVIVLVGIILYVVLRIRGVIHDYTPLLGAVDEIGTWLGVCGFFVSLYTFINTKTLLDNRKQNVKKPSIKDGDVVLAVSIGENNKIRGDVTRYLWNNKEMFKNVLDGKDFQDTEKFVTLWNNKKKNSNRFVIEYGLEKHDGIDEKNHTKNGRMVSIYTGNLVPSSDCLQQTKADLYEVLEEFYLELSSEMVNKIHLFYKGPVVFEAVIGDFFSNQNRVELYHFAGENYIYAGSLTKFKSDIQEIKENNGGGSGDGI